MICVSIGRVEIRELLHLLPEIPLAEVRLDLNGFSLEETDRIFSTPTELIATCRPGGIGEAECRAYLQTAMKAGAAFVDVEIERKPGFKGWIRSEADRNGTRVMISYHNHSHTPCSGELKAVVERGLLEGDLVKIACMVQDERDCARLLSLYDMEPVLRGRLIVIGMGEKGRFTRPAALLMGAPFTYASLAPGRGTAPGQMDRESLKNCIRCMEPENENEN